MNAHIVLPFIDHDVLYIYEDTNFDRHNHQKRITFVSYHYIYDIYDKTVSIH